MKTAAIVCLSVGIAAAVAAIVIQTVRIIKAGRADRKAVLTIVFAAIYTVVAALNFILVLPNL